MQRKLLLIILDGVPWRNWRRLFGNLEGWVQSGEARVWKMRAVLPSTSACCYASIHTGVPPQVHGILSNEVRFRVSQPDIFSEVARAGGRTGAVTHSYWSEFFRSHPFDLVEDMEYDEPDGPITHGRFHTMTGYGHDNQMTPSCTPARWTRWATASATTTRRWTMPARWPTPCSPPSCRNGAPPATRSW